MVDIKDYRQALGKRIRYLRKLREYSQEELAELAGISRVHMGYVEQGARTPSLDLILKLSGVLHVPMRELFDFVWTGNPNSVEYGSGFDD